MARTTNRLSARKAETLREPGRHSDGGGLYLYIDKAMAKRWLFIYRSGGKQREMGLGSLTAVPLAQAREKAAQARSLLAQGLDPLAEKARAATVKAAPTFGEAADSFIAAREASWRNGKHADQWRMTLIVYAAPLRAIPVDQVTTQDVIGVLTPLWQSRPETASRLRGRIEAVLDAARAAGHIAGPWSNPAMWRGHLAHILPRPKKLQRGHHAALPYRELPAFMEALSEQEGMAPRALAFTILTAARTGEILGMTWDEVDLDGATWTVPKARMKGHREHRVPLSEPALAALRAMEGLRSPLNPHVFPGLKPGRPLSNMAFSMLLRRMKRGDLTAHGFRSCFRDWCGEETATPREIAEQALAHVVGNAVERAYRRGDAFAKRRSLMDAWAAFACGTKATVLPLRRA